MPRPSYRKGTTLPCSASNGLEKLRLSNDLRVSFQFGYTPQCKVEAAQLKTLLTFAAAAVI
jgi:hypothetical protein